MKKFLSAAFGRVLCIIAFFTFAHQGALGGGAAFPTFGEAKRLPERELLPKLLPANQLANLGVSTPFVIDGEQVFRSGSVLIASEIIFRPGSKLVLAPTSQSPGVDQAVYLVTRRIVVEPGKSPAIVTWGGSSASLSSPPPAGKAAPGAAGYDGAPGGPGANGANGSSGTPGRSPPTLYIATAEIAGGP